MAHELGHLLMHTLPTEGQEREANEFASEFLCPGAEIGPELVGLKTSEFPRLLRLKQKWGVSVAALIRRARDLGIITDRQYRSFQISLNQMGWREVEPKQPELEVPTTIRRLIEAKIAAGKSAGDLALDAGMLEDKFLEVYFPDQKPRPQMQLHLGREAQ
jgi:Zn-dependent peptidase ImmA (M78 family)